MSTFRPRKTSQVRTRVRGQGYARTTFRAVAPPLLGFVHAHEPSEPGTVVHLTYQMVPLQRGVESNPVATLCGQRLVHSAPRSPGQIETPPCPMCLDTAMNDTAAQGPVSH